MQIKYFSKKTISLFIGLILILGIGLFVLYENHQKEIAQEKETIHALRAEIKALQNELKNEEFVSIVDEDSSGENAVVSKWLDDWKSGDQPFHENKMRQTIREMTHQKIIAEKKVNSIMITPTRVQTLITMVKENHEFYETADIYLTILNRWQNGNFKLIDNDHNEMMRLQEQVEGRATGVANDEQEKDFLYRVYWVGEGRSQ